MTKKEWHQNHTAEERRMRMRIRNKLGLPQYEMDLKKENIRFLSIE